jgi:hypothetical protein
MLFDRGDATIWEENAASFCRISSSALVKSLVLTYQANNRFYVSEAHKLSADFYNQAHIGAGGHLAYATDLGEGHNVLLFNLKYYNK